MIGGAVIEALQKFVPRENIHLQEPMAAHTTFRIGGPADCFVELENEEQLKKVRKYLEMAEVSFFVLGNGSNLLVNDTGYRGIILQTGSRMNSISVQGDHIFAKAGATLAQVARAAMEQGLTGLEFASGIPGTVGGGVVMNAGAYGGELGQVISSVSSVSCPDEEFVREHLNPQFSYRHSQFQEGDEFILRASFSLKPGGRAEIKAKMDQKVTQVNVVSREGELLELDNGTMEFGYRTSIIRQSPFIVTEVTFRLEPGDRSVIKGKMEELAARRREKQPLEVLLSGPKGILRGSSLWRQG